ncbi:membrane protein [Microbispora rosea subsp. aerata]|nr:glycerophosphoryl diester phosphodiesterase membrane domain-containing protein [Microbispora rosea]GGO12323.1 membrane protein [Microbispora rosea subsp. aerata]GIH58632.1 membrane protein [Microbispora rosea subsp. aerata]GLJ84686.1 membrane protein [Microbispora rosea subsp. aerata]
MTDGPGSTPDVPPGWAAEQPPPYRGAAGSWASPGAPQGPAAPSGPPHHAAYPPSPYAGPYGYPPQDAPRPGVIPLRPLALGDIVDGTIKLIRSNPKATLALSAIVAAITAIPVSIGQALSLGTIGQILADPYAAETLEAPASGTAAQSIGTIISYVMTFVGTTVLTGMLTRVLGRAVFGGRITVGEAWRLARARVPALLGLVLLQTLIFLLPLLVLFPPFLGLASAGAFAAIETDGAWLAVLAGVPCLLAYLSYLMFFYTRLSLAAPAIVLEGRGIADSMSRSWRLVKGDSWRVLGILLLTLLLTAVIGTVLALPFTLVGSLLGVLSGGTAAGTVLTALLLALGQVLASMITYPFQAGVGGLLYADRRMRAEAFDLVLQTAAERNQAQGWVHAGVDDLWHPSYAAGTGPDSGPSHGAPPHGPYGPYGPRA